MLKIEEVILGSAAVGLAAKKWFLGAQPVTLEPASLVPVGASLNYW